MAEETSDPMRLDPAQTEGKLVASEHLARYVWAAQLAGGRDVLDAGCGLGYGTRIIADAGARRVLGVDIDVEAIARAGLAISDQSAQAGAASGQERVARPSTGVGEVLVADVADLPLATASFDLVICFEVIEHLDQQARTIEELRRVLRPDGLLLISTPNREQYPPGNPHHTREFTVSEFERLLRAQFSTVELYRQQPWLGSLITPLGRSGQCGGPSPSTTYHTLSRGSAPDVFIVAAASARPSDTVLEPVAVLGAAFELRWWHDQLMEARRENQRLLVAAGGHAEMERRIATITQRLEQAERDNSRIAELEQYLVDCESVARTFESSILGRVGRAMFHLRSRFG